ncbi:MAG TPA: DUF4325 domain-containing protein [Solirubrobacteraceae bacterium]|jgi:hypothetical protein|nr:DUF4325 domain-containing protein [Solirubrobacteraceae bacterium]
MQFRLAEYGLVFSTRDRGSRMRADLLEHISETSAGTVTIDFAGVLSSSYSFIDEFIGKLVGLTAPVSPTVVNATPMITETIEKSLRRRGLDPDRVLAAALQYV